MNVLAELDAKIGELLEKSSLIRLEMPIISFNFTKFLFRSKIGSELGPQIEKQHWTCDKLAD